MTWRAKLAMRVEAPREFRIAPNSRPISASVLERAGVLPFFLEQPRVFDGDGNMRAELTQHHLVHVGELARVLAQEIQRANHAALAPERDDQLRVRERHGLDIARIEVDVVDENRTPFRHRRAHQPVPDLDVQRAFRVFGIPDRVRDRQRVARRVEQIHRERVKCREPGDELRNLRQQLVEIEHRRHLAPQLEERDDELPDVGGKRGGGNGSVGQNVRT